MPPHANSVLFVLVTNAGFVLGRRELEVGE